MKYTYDNCVLSTDEGYALMWKQDTPEGWAVAIMRYGQGHLDDELIAKAFADSEANARIIANALAHHLICSDCHDAEAKARGAKQASN